MKPRILIVEDDALARTAMTDWILEMGYSVESTESGHQALKILAERSFDILVTDENMPGLQGHELIEIAASLYPDMACIVQSGFRDPERIVHALNEHKVHQYLFKPFSPADLKQAIDRAFEHIQLREKVNSLRKNEESLFRLVLEVFDWKETLRARQRDIASHMINQLNISFFQGSGVGSLISTLSLLFQESAEAQSDRLTVPRSIHSLVQQEYEAAVRVVASLNRAQTVMMRHQLKPVAVCISDIQRELDTIREELTPILAVKGQQIIIGSRPACTQSILVEPELLAMAIREAFYNAMKYSPEQSSIFALIDIHDQSLILKFLNSIDQESQHALNQDATGELLFEPFFRISSVVDDRFSSEEFAFGLGLPVVRHIMKLHGGSSYLYPITNHIGVSVETNFCLIFRLPFAMKESEPDHGKLGQLKRRRELNETSTHCR